jgi:putative copper resistance protein D
MLGSWDLPSSPYGRLLITKATLFAALMALASLNRWRYGPALAGGSRAAVKSFGRTTVVEYLLLATILAVTATLTTLYSPES